MTQTQDLQGPPTRTSGLKCPSVPPVRPVYRPTVDISILPVRLETAHRDQDKGGGPVDGGRTLTN